MDNSNPNIIVVKGNLKCKTCGEELEINEDWTIYACLEKMTAFETEHNNHVTDTNVGDTRQPPVC